MPKFVLLWTDAAFWLLFIALLVYGVVVLRNAQMRANWRKVFFNGPALASSLILVLCLGVALLDSLHYRPRLAPVADAPNAEPAYDSRTRSLLDAIVWDLIASREATYSRPLSYLGFTKESQTIDGVVQRVAPRLKFGGASLRDPAAQWAGDVAERGFVGLLLGAVAAAVLSAIGVALIARSLHAPFGLSARDILGRRTQIPWHAAFGMLWVLCLVIGPSTALSGPYHLLGTDLTGNDVLLQSLKSIRTAFVIGSLATVATLPLAVGFGLLAGYFKGWVDEAIQYLYTVLSSIPNVLLIAACVLMVQVFLDKNPNLFETGAERADVKLFLLCAVLGLTGWAGLCRLLRGETLKLRELEYVQAANAFGVGDLRIMGAPHLPERRPPDADRHGARILVADPLRGGAVLCGRGCRPVDEQLRRHDQSGAQRDEP